MNSLAHDITQRIQRNVPLAPFTTFQIGGEAEFFCSVRSASELVLALDWADSARMPRTVLGMGANVLISDQGIPGLVIHNRSGTVEVLPDNRIRADSGVSIQTLIELTSSRGMSGLEHFVGIPSSVGGAAWQNLHFLSPDRSETLYFERVVIGATVRVEGRVEAVARDFFAFGYDTSVLHHRDVIVLDVLMQFEPQAVEVIAERIDNNLAWRAAKHPPGAVTCSAGSIFKKIEGIGAGRLIDAAGLKGRGVGAAYISPHHANYIINRGGATARDVLTLIREVQDRVFLARGFRLEPEITILGFPAR